ncbi:MAG: bifunctional alpha,alpha-trehalose-phosphate synthase (UDP-forming)/trehalose-phosphatase [Deltaproteobacteria bacterium]|nr:bifunctional alpha,alpha-trehalose-phosphate synthase (UDP-forming)/trehalose-phosphatase [Deltaproteobacteria bacterium]
MSRLVIVSNRLPVNTRIEKGVIKFERSIGGLATGLSSLGGFTEQLWLGWPGLSESETNDETKAEIERRLGAEHGCHPVFIDDKDFEGFYSGFSNDIVWPLFHYFTQYVNFDKEYWEAYKRVNLRFCDALMDVVKEGDIIWVHDYQLMLLPSLIRERLPDISIGYFHHIPFPSYEIFRLLPWRKEILEGLLGADLIGFHIFDYTRHFLSSIHRIIGHEENMGIVNTGKRILKVDTFPMGIDFSLYSSSVDDPRVREMMDSYREEIGERKVILSVDRLDYTKGIPQRLNAFDTFLGKYPEYKEKVVLIEVAVPSRTEVEQYQKLKKDIDEEVGRINGSHGTMGWVPVWYFYRALSKERLCALYNIADVALITPLRDGMNLIAKEFIATKRDGRGVLVLSETAGASKELVDAVTVNPNDIDGVASALKRALTMPEDEQVERNRAMQGLIGRMTVGRWAGDFLKTLDLVKDQQKNMRSRILKGRVEEEFLASYRGSSNRLIFLDYDGTLSPFHESPEKASPDEALMAVLRELSRDKANHVVLISGRDRDTLDGWFGPLGIDMIAEHGVWLKHKFWRMVETLTDEWKDDLRPILDSYTDRTPGSFIEEKDYSLVWHYRRADTGLSKVRVRELVSDLVGLTANLPLQVLEGSKVVEVKNIAINKGTAAERWMASKDLYDFIMAIGDDTTDEDLFAALPDDAYTIKVGLAQSYARFNVREQAEVPALLKRLTQSAP